MSCLINDQWGGDNGGGVALWRDWLGKVQRKVCSWIDRRGIDGRAKYDSLSSLRTGRLCMFEKGLCICYEIWSVFFGVEGFLFRGRGVNCV